MSRLAGIALLAACIPVAAQSVILFDFNNAPAYTPLPLNVTVGGVTAHLSATGQGYSIQNISAVPVQPVGFSGNFIYPSSVYLADLLVSFDHTVTSFSILFAPDELGCDDSARMRVTAYRDTTLVGTNTAIAPNPGTYPVGTLSCSFVQGFNNVVVHYDAHPPTCQDYGVIFFADDMSITVPLAATAVPVGTGCGGTGIPVFSATPPKFGQLTTFSLLQGSPLAFGMLYYSPPPAGPDAFGPTCWAYVDVAAVTPFLALSTDMAGAWSGTYPVPLEPGLSGVQLVLQIALFATASPIGFDVTNAMLVTIGY